MSDLPRAAAIGINCPYFALIQVPINPAFPDPDNLSETPGVYSSVKRSVWSSGLSEPYLQSFNTPTP